MKTHAMERWFRESAISLTHVCGNGCAKLTPPRADYGRSAAYRPQHRQAADLSILESKDYAFGYNALRRSREAGRVIDPAKVVRPAPQRGLCRGAWATWTTNHRSSCDLKGRQQRRPFFEVTKVRFGSLADIGSGSVMSELPLKADIPEGGLHVR